MLKKALVLILFVYFLILLQTSFCVHFQFFGFVPDVILIFIVIANIFENPKNNYGILAGFIGGIFLDIFSSSPIGFHILIFTTLSFLIKTVLRKYVWAPIG